ncbi:hypothetical protein ES703_14229 [subsurface metagenome]
MQGIDSDKYTDDKAAIGTLAHHMILCHLKGIEPDTSDYSAKQIDQAETCLIKYWDWEKHHILQTILAEHSLVSQLDNYGGTLDWYGYLDDIPTLIDYKTGKRIYPEMAYQLAAYLHLLVEAGYTAPQHLILRIGRDPSEGFEPFYYSSLDKQWLIFKHCRGIYQLQKELR